MASRSRVVVFTAEGRSFFVTPERWREMTAIFHEALTYGSAERGAFIASKCGDDAALRRDVESMLVAHREGGALDAIPAFAAAVALEARSSRSVVLTAGTRLGPYEILFLRGAGGMGAVYRARDTQLDRDVALKVLLPAVADDPDRLARFAREARRPGVTESFQHRDRLWP